MVGPTPAPPTMHSGRPLHHLRDTFSSHLTRPRTFPLPTSHSLDRTPNKRPTAMNRGTPSVACLRCRKQKLRCTREHPICRRCERAKGECVYPSPPDRRRLALERALERTGSVPRSNLSPSREHMPQTLETSAQTSSYTRHVGESAIIHSQSANVPPSGGLDPALDSNLATRTRPSPRPTQSALDSSVNSGQGVSLSSEVALFLTEIYFERHYEAEFLFCKQRFIRDYIGGTLPSYVSLAVFAFASLFLAHVPGGLTQGEIGVAEITRADWSVIGGRWAEQASQGALMHADKPCIQHVQACQTLALFWFARSETIRTNMHTGTLVGRPTQRPDTMKLTRDRWEVQQFVPSLQQGNRSPSNWGSELLLLDQKLESLYDQMNASLKYDQSRAGTRNNPRYLGRLFSLNYLYHLCVSYLHSSLVPVLSCSMRTPNVSRSMLRLAAEQALKHSTIMTNMTEHFLTQRTAISKLWPIVGYGAYVCAAIQLRYFLALGILTEERLERTRVHLKIVDELRKYWKTLQPLV
ncbi:hypothetical protein AUP68_00620 [Ilyonectria robusta]